MKSRDHLYGLTQEKLLDLIIYDSETGQFSLRKKMGRWPAGFVVGFTRKDGYRDVSVCGRRYLAHRLAWFYTHGTWPADQIDHVNGNRSDNRLCNLREASKSENMRNNPGHSCRSSSHRGVGCRREYGKEKWYAQIRKDGLTVKVSGFETEAQAIVERLRLEAEYHGEFSCSASRGES